MSKAHLFAPMKWVKEQFSKLNSDIAITNSKLPHVQKGRTHLNVASKTVKYATITFDEPFEEAPRVVATLNAVLEKSVVHRISVYNVTTTGFMLYFYNDWSGGNADLYADWIAILE